MQQEISLGKLLSSPLDGDLATPIKALESSKKCSTVQLQSSISQDSDQSARIAKKRFFKTAQTPHPKKRPIDHSLDDQEPTPLTQNDCLLRRQTKASGTESDALLDCSFNTEFTLGWSFLKDSGSFGKELD